MDSIRTILLPTLLSLVLLACSDGKKSPSMGLDGTMPGQDSLGGDIGSDLQTMADDIGDALDDGSEDTDFSADQADIPTEDGVDVTHPQPCAEYPPGWLDGLCQDFCDQLEKYDFNSMFAPPEECLDACHEVLAEEPDWLANFVCVAQMEQHYFFGNCWWPKPLDPVPNCDLWCDEVIACGLEEMFEVPSEPCLCEAVCNGFWTVTGEAGQPLIDCAIEELQNNCDVFEMMDCFGQPLNCEEACISLEDKCADGEDISDLFSSQEACIEACEEATQEQVFTTEICVAVTECKNASVCKPVPEEPAAGCFEFCEAYESLCPGNLGVPPSLCPWACTGIAMGIPGSKTVGSAACVESFDMCPDDPLAVLFGCLVGPCTTLCYQVPESCEPGTSYFDLYEDETECMAECKMMTPLGAQASGICHLMTECNAAEICSVPPAEAIPGCDVYCEGLAELCPADFSLAGDSCEALCTGVGMVMPVSEPQTGPECLEQFPECPEDPYDALFTCMSGKCGSMCGWFGVCEDDSPYHGVFESPDTCSEYCDTLSINQAQMTSYCLGWAGCDQAPLCIDPPEETADGCDVYCDTVLELCPDNGTINNETCPEGCTGIAMALPGAKPGEADFCLAEFTECTENPAEVVYWCMSKTEQTCSDACAAVADCDLTIDWVCDVFCTVLKFTDPNVHTAFTNCVLNANNCDAMMPCVGQ